MLPDLGVPSKNAAGYQDITTSPPFALEFNSTFCEAYGPTAEAFCLFYVHFWHVCVMSVARDLGYLFTAAQVVERRLISGFHVNSSLAV